MKRSRLLDIKKILEKKEEQILLSKGNDYASEEECLSNFKRIAQTYSISPILACAILLEKHIDAIRIFVRTGTTSSEAVEDRIIDARNYLLFLKALEEERKEKEDVHS